MPRSNWPATCTFSSAFSGCRGDGGNNWDPSPIKNGTVKERIKVQLRAEAINFMNHPQYLPPNMSSNSKMVIVGSGKGGLPVILNPGQ